MRRYLQLSCDEPYRLFFPLAWLAGVAGVLLWPLFYLGAGIGYPGVLHARWMVEGFLGGFVFGFLGTAGPRLSGSRTFSARELGGSVALYLGALGAHGVGWHVAGDAVFLLLLLGFAARLGRGFVRAGRLPAPGFLLAGLGFGCALVGLPAVLAGEAGWLGGRWPVLGAVLLNEVWVLFLVLGVGSFLFPRLLQIPPRVPDLGWWGGKFRAAASGAALLALYLAEGWVAAPRALALGRAAVAALCLVWIIGLHRARSPWVTLVWAMQLGSALLWLGLLFPVAWPLHRVEGLHVLFIGGFTVITIAVATRVVLGHGGLGARCAKRLPVLAVAVFLFLGGLVLRVGGDFWLPWRTAAIHAGAALWLVGALVWGLAILPHVCHSEAPVPSGKA